jgi:polyhydroxybutyrate depolymerase
MKHWLLAFSAGCCLLLGACGCRKEQRAPSTTARSRPPAAPPKTFRFALCSEAPRRLDGPPGAKQSRGCVVHFEQVTTDPQTIETYGQSRFDRRYLVYVPERLPTGPMAVVFVFPGFGASAETAAFYYTHTRFEELAERDGFVVVYGNGLPIPPPGGEEATPLANAGYLRGCFCPHEGEGVDVAYVREILAQLETKLSIDRTRIYATGLSAGGGFSFELALEAPDLVAAIAPVAPLPFQPEGPWLFGCHPKPGYERVSILMVAATADPFISYERGPSSEYPDTQYPGMEETRDTWRRAMGIANQPSVVRLPDEVSGDSYRPHSGLDSSFIEQYSYPPGPQGQEFRYYKAVGMGHWWPDPSPSWVGLWKRFGKANQDIRFADHAWEFFRERKK